MKARVAKGGAITSALAYAFCWQLPLILASFGLGSFTMSVWLARYRWLFLAATLVFLAVAFYYTYKDRNKAGPWSVRLLYGTTALSVVFVVYSFIVNWRRKSMVEQEKNTTVSNCWPPGGQTDGRQKTDSHSFHIPNQLKPTEIPPENLKQIRAVIRKKYAEVSNSAEGHFQYTTGQEGAVLLGYDNTTLQDIKPELLNSFCGVGNPFSINEIKPGSVILDIGCGAGFDLIVASRLTGPSGCVYGIDLTEEMVAKAKENIKKSGSSNVTVEHVDSDELPFADQFFDTVISNGVINLSPQKLKLFEEIHRVLKPDGTLQFADIVTESELPQGMTGSLEAWAQWIGGTILVEDQLELMQQAGFVNVECLGKTGVRTSQYTVGALFRAYKTGVI